MSPFRLKVMRFMVPLLLPIGRVESTGNAQESEDLLVPPSIQYFEDNAPMQRVEENRRTVPVGGDV